MHFVYNQIPGSRSVLKTTANHSVARSAPEV